MLTLPAFDDGVARVACRAGALCPMGTRPTDGLEAARIAEHAQFLALAADADFVTEATLV